jgi:Flp pilus assembly pilin Flp
VAVLARLFTQRKKSGQAIVEYGLILVLLVVVVVIVLIAMGNQLHN